MRALSNKTLVEAAARKALTTEQFQKTAEHFRKLCQTPGEELATLEQTAEALREAGFKHELMHLLREAVEQPTANPHVGTLWIRRVVESKIWDHRYPEGLDELCANGEVGHRAVIEFLLVTGKKRRAGLVLKAIARHRHWLRVHPDGWSAAGRALVFARCYRQASRWMSNWREQASLDNPTLYALAMALRASGKSAQSEEVVRVALERPGAADQFPMFKLWLAQDQAFAGNTPEASITFKQIDPSGWDDDALALYYLVRGVIRVQKAQDGHQRDAFTTARQRVRELFRKAPIWKRDVYLRRQYHTCFVRMAKASRNVPERVTSAWRSAHSLSVLWVLLLVPGFQLFAPCYLYRLCANRRGRSK
jgi:hypothetical protein